MTGAAQNLTIDNRTTHALRAGFKGDRFATPEE
jgi:hypothetical protein